MISGSSTLVAVRRRDGSNLSKVSGVSQEGSRPGTLVLQMLLGELASLKQQVNSLVVAGSTSLQPMRHLQQKGNTTESERVQPERLTRFFD